MQEANPGKLAPDESTLSAGEIQAQLERILASAAFINADRLSRFLRVTVERALAGELEHLKEYAIGKDVFDRGENYDPRVDSIVRVEARRLRAKLQLYYDKLGQHDPVLIVYRRGSYVPAFRRQGLQGEPPEPETAPPAAPIDARALAVLPFANLSPDSDQDYFCDGVTDEIINTLAGVRDIKVIARTSLFHFRQQTGDVREIGRKLGAGTIIEGSVRKAGAQLRISASVVDVATGHHLWTASFDRELEDVFAIQDEIARAVAGSLKLTLAPLPRSSPSRAGAHDLEAHTLLLRGRYLWNKMTPSGYRAAIEVFQQAISRFPAYAPLYAGLADAFSLSCFWGMMPPGQAIPPARAAALEALRLDDSLAEAYVSLGGILVFIDRQWDEGAKALRRAAELQPNNVAAHNYAAIERLVRGHHEEAIGLLEKAISLDPISLKTNRALAWAYYYLRQYDKAAIWLHRALEIDPDFREAHYFLGQILLRKGLYTEAEAEFQKIGEQPSSAMKLGAMGETYARSGRIDEAREMLAHCSHPDAGEYMAPVSCVPICAALGDWEAVFGWLERAYEEDSPWLVVLGLDPLYDPVRSDARFRNLLRRLHLE